ncbi:hypothetical protein ACRAWB_13650 [Leifsonia poae]|uniref:hypothetical protein n=1 Tax=Leifsonia poae TaxID=110933 RepID=UPI003D69EA60
MVVWTLAVLCLAAGVVSAALVVPSRISSAASTALSTVYKTGTNVTDGSKAASSDTPGGSLTGTAKPGDTIKWVVNYANNNQSAASVNVKDVFSSAGSFVPGSLEIPRTSDAATSISPQYTTNGGSTWTQGSPPPSGVNGVGYTGILVPSGTQARSPAFSTNVGSAVSTVGGDGYNAVVRNGLIYSVYHHNSGNYVYCSQPSGATCPGWPTGANAQKWSSVAGTAIGTGPFPNMTTAWQNGTWLSGNKLYWLAALTDASSTGIACLDLTALTPTSCGYSPITTASGPWQPLANLGSSGVPAGNGNIYIVALGNLTGARPRCISTASPRPGRTAGRRR